MFSMASDKGLTQLSAEMAVKSKRSYQEFKSLMKDCCSANEKVLDWLHTNCCYLSEADKMKVSVWIENGPTWKRSNMLKALTEHIRHVVMEELNDNGTDTAKKVVKRKVPKWHRTARCNLYETYFKHMKGEEGIVVGEDDNHAFTGTSTSTTTADGWPTKAKWDRYDCAGKLKCLNHIYNNANATFMNKQEHGEFIIATIRKLRNEMDWNYENGDKHLEQLTEFLCEAFTKSCDDSDFVESVLSDALSN